MVLKQRTSIRVGGTNVQGNVSTADFTSDAIRFKDVSRMTLSLFFDSLVVAGKDPTLTIQESNSTDIDSFITVFGAEEVDLPEFFSDFEVEAEYIRFIYASNGATGGTIDYAMNKILNNGT